MNEQTDNPKRKKETLSFEILKKIKTFRKAKKIGMKEMADRFNISLSGYVKIENGENVLSLYRFIEICRILEIKSYNKILPELNNETIAKIKLALLTAGDTFDTIKKNSSFTLKLIDSLIEKIKSSNSNKNDSIVQELEMLILYIELINRESSRNDVSIFNVSELVDEID